MTKISQPERGGFLEFYLLVTRILWYVSRKTYYQLTCDVISPPKWRFEIRPKMNVGMWWSAAENRKKISTIKYCFVDLVTNIYSCLLWTSRVDWEHLKVSTRHIFRVIAHFLFFWKNDPRTTWIHVFRSKPFFTDNF